MRSRSGPSPTWSAPHTRVFAAGLLEYEDGEHWPKEGRRDQVLIDTLQQRGVKPSSIVFMKDGEIKKKQFTRKFEQHLKASSEDEILFFYYAGHGSRDEHGVGTLCLLNEEEFCMADVFTLIEAHFKGSLAIITADCCCSGSFAQEALLRAARVQYAVLASSMSTTLSTGAWTFTNCLIEGFSGHVAVDQDADGHLSLSELAAYIDQSMGQRESQLSTFVATPGFPAGLLLSTASTRAAPQIGTLVSAMEDGVWYRAEIVAFDATSGTYTVKWIDFDDEQGQVHQSNTRPYSPQQLAPGTSIKVNYEEEWWNATVLAARHGMHLVRYQDYGPHWDEWVSFDRIET